MGAPASRAAWPAAPPTTPGPDEEPPAGSRTHLFLEPAWTAWATPRPVPDFTLSLDISLLQNGHVENLESLRILITHESKISGF